MLYSDISGLQSVFIYNYLRKTINIIWLNEIIILCFVYPLLISRKMIIFWKKKTPESLANIIMSCAHGMHITEREIKKKSAYKHYSLMYMNCLILTYFKLSIR